MSRALYRNRAWLALSRYTHKQTRARARIACVRTKLKLYFIRTRCFWRKAIRHIARVRRRQPAKIESVEPRRSINQLTIVHARHTQTHTRTQEPGAEVHTDTHCVTSKRMRATASANRARGSARKGIARSWCVNHALRRRRRRRGNGHHVRSSSARAASVDRAGLQYAAHLCGCGGGTNGTTTW